MRTDEVMYKLILDFAEEDDAIYGILLNGSRANPERQPDEWSDFDIVYVVKDIRKYQADLGWLDYFGEIAIMQEPDKLSPATDNSDTEASYTFLAQFTDGNRIDFSFQTVDFALGNYRKDRLLRVLLDKHNLFTDAETVSEVDYYVAKPSTWDYVCCVNEFWWVAVYVAKGLKRQQLIYALEHLNNYLRPMLLQMLQWKIGVDNDFSVNCGYCGRYLKQLAKGEDWQRLLATYPSSDSRNIEEALKVSCVLFSDLAVYVGEKLQYPYNVKEEKGSLAIIRLLLQKA